MATGKPFPAFEKAWLAHVRKQPFPKELLPLADEKVRAQGGRAGEGQGREEGPGDLLRRLRRGGRRPPARKFAHLGELMRERNRIDGRRRGVRQGARAGGRQVRVRLQQVRAGAAGAEAAGRGGEGAARLAARCTRARRDARCTWGASTSAAARTGRRRRHAYLEALAADPFDPEIHLALLKLGAGARASSARPRRAGQRLGRPDRASRPDRLPELLARRPGRPVPTRPTSRSPVRRPSLPHPPRAGPREGGQSTRTDGHRTAMTAPHASTPLTQWSPEPICARWKSWPGRGTAILEQIEKRVVGQREVVEHLLISLFSRGHCLFVGVPGPGQDAAHLHPGGRAQPLLQPHPVHART